MAYMRTRTEAQTDELSGRLLPEDFAPYSDVELRHLADKVEAAAGADAQAAILKESKAGAALLRRAGTLEGVLKPLLGAFGPLRTYADAA